MGRWGPPGPVIPARTSCFAPEEAERSHSGSQGGDSGADHGPSGGARTISFTDFPRPTSTRRDSK